MITWWDRVKHWFGVHKWGNHVDVENPDYSNISAADYMSYHTCVICSHVEITKYWF